jgi:DNA-binding IclR family transcriptional regulator
VAKELPQLTSPLEGSAGRALALMEAFAGTRSVLGVTELARAADLPKSTVHRLLSVMVERGFVRRTGIRYCLTERVFEIGNRAGSGSIKSTGMRHRAMPYMAELFASTHETVHLATISQTDVLYLEKIFGHEAGVRCLTAVGGRMPAYATALGKAMLAFSADEVLERNLSVQFRPLTGCTIRSGDQLEKTLERVREEGFATDISESFPGVNCVAAAIRSPHTGLVLGAISISSVKSVNVYKRYGSMLQRSANDLSRVLVSYE